MDEPSFTQKDVDSVWHSVWNESPRITARAAFSSRAFIEGYAVIKPHIPEGARSILEVGTGVGRYAAAFARDFPSARVTATDILEESLVHAATLKEEIKLRNIFIERQDALALSYADNSFDIVFSDAVIQHVPDEKKMISEMARVTVPGGFVIVSSVNAVSVHAFARFVQRLFGRKYRYGVERMYTHEAFRRLATGAGLEVVSVEGFFPAYGVYRLKRFWKGFALLGRALNRVTRFFDRYSGRWLSNYLGFELVLVARKPKSASA